MKPLPPIKSIRRYCLTRCSGGSRKSVRECADQDCPNFIYRMGRNLSRAGIGVGTRDPHGRFTKKVASSAVGLSAVSGIVDTFASRPDLCKLGASGEEIGHGHIRIKRINQNIIITLQTDSLAMKGNE